MKQETFAALMGISRTTVSNLECGRQRVFLDHVVRAAGVLEVPLAELLPPSDYAPNRPTVFTASDAPIPDSAAIAVTKTIATVAQKITGSPDTRSRQRATRRS
jgi:transcriptional regulator with XRE-family HTH domain